MSAVAPVLAAAAVAAVLTLLGRRLGGGLAGPGDGALFRLVLYSASGWLGLHLLLTGLQLVGLHWSAASVLPAIAALYLLARRWLPAAAGRTRLPSDAGWGDAVAVAALAVFAICALSVWIATPDFFYHWGLKGERFFLARGVDYPYLARPWNWVVHPDYPNLVPELFAVSALAAGRFSEPAMMLWAPLTFALLLAAAREALRRAGASRAVAQAALATLALAAAAYGIGGLAAGGADLLIALAATAALPPLLSPPTARGAAQVGLLAALAAATKVEGAPLGAILIAVYAARAWSAHRARPRLASPAGVRGAAALVLPFVVVVVPWLAAVRRHHLFVPFNAGPLTPSRLPVVLAALADNLPDPHWHGFAWAVLALPLLALRRRLRPVAAVVALQALFYLYVFLSVRIDPVPLIQASLPRLVLHLLPAVLVGIAVAIEAPGAPLAGPRPPPTTAAPAGPPD